MERARIMFREAGSLERRLRNSLETAVRSKSVGQETPPHEGLQGREASIRARREVESMGNSAGIGTDFQRVQGKDLGGWGGQRWVRLEDEQSAEGQMISSENDRGNLGPRP